MLTVAWCLIFIPITTACTEDRKFQQIETALQKLHEANEKQLVINGQFNRANQQLQKENTQLKLGYHRLAKQQRKYADYLENQLIQNKLRKSAPYNVSIEELEIRVERLEEEMYQAQVDISENIIDIDSLQFSLQETIETVIDHANILDQLDQDITDIETSTGELKNRTTDIEQDIVDINSSIEGLEARISTVEQIQFETKDSAFFATLSNDAIFEEIIQPIIFDNDKINEGGHYNITTGIYTVPVSGIYQFFAYVRANPKATFRIYIDELLYVNPIEEYGPAGLHGDGTSCTVKLQAGQNVQVYTGNQPYNVTGDPAGSYSWFGGHLLFPDTA